MKSEGYEIDLYNIAKTPPAKMLDYKKLIIGCPTWHIGELQDDWDAIYEEYKKLDFSNVTAAFSGLSKGVEPNSLDMESTIGANIPPPLAVFEGTTGPKISSAQHKAYPRPLIVLPR